MQIEDIILLLISWVHLYLSPFTKVEESFNLQATHDVIFHTFFETDHDALFYGKNATGFSNYDHLEFPGVVPRTFVGPLILSASQYPVLWIVQTFLSVSPYTLKQTSFYLTRMTLCFLNWAGLMKLKSAVSRQYGNLTGRFLIGLTASQFHLVYYMSRTLPNSFSMLFISLGFSYWINKNIKRSILCLCFATIVFRCDTILLSGIIGLFMLFSKDISIWNGVFVGAISIIISLAVTLSVDSFFWNPPKGMKIGENFEIIDFLQFFHVNLGFNLVWPEGQVFYFNVIENKSSEWGVMPLHWYFTNCLPKALLIALPLIPFGFLRIPLGSPHFDTMILKTVFPAILFICLYSSLPHKEMRFILPVFPILNIAAASFMVKLQRIAMPSKKDNIAPVSKGISSILLGTILGGILMSFCVSCFFLIVSMENYPGGNAITTFNEYILSYANRIEQKDAVDLKVHFGTYGLMTGISRYHQLTPGAFDSPMVNYEYSKDNDETVLNQLCGENSMKLDFIFLDYEIYRTREKECKENKYVVFESFGGEPRVNFWTIRFSIIPENAVVLLVNEESIWNQFTKDFLIQRFERKARWKNLFSLSSYLPKINSKQFNF